MITPRDAWQLARALDDPIDAALDLLHTDRLRATMRLESASKAHDWLDSMATYVSGEDAVIRLPGWVALALQDNDIEVPDRKPIVIWLDQEATYKLNSLVHDERGEAMRAGDVEAITARTLELQELWASRHKDRRSHFSAWSPVAVAAARHGIIPSDAVYEGPWDRFKTPV